MLISQNMIRRDNVLNARSYLVAKEERMCDFCFKKKIEEFLQIRNFHSFSLRKIYSTEFYFIIFPISSSMYNIKIKYMGHRFSF